MRRRLSYLLPALFFLLITAWRAEAAYSVPSAHPRLFISGAEVSALRERCRKISPYKEVYAALKSRVDGWGSPAASRYVIGYEIQAVVFVALVENYSPSYMNKVDAWLINLFEAQNVVSLASSGDGGAIWGSADIILGVAQAYDWLYPALAPSKRMTYGTYLRNFQKAVIANQGGMARDSSRSDYSNQFYYFDGMLSVTGIALHNDGIDDKLALSYLRTFDAYLHNHMIPTINQVGGANGGWHEGPGYLGRAMTYFAIEIEAWRTGTGTDVFAQVTGLKGLDKWLFYSTQPNGDVANIGDVAGWPTGWNKDAARRSALLAARYSDGFSQRIVKSVNPISASNWPYAVSYLLWYDPGVAPVDTRDLPTDAYFDGIGWASMRGSWSGGSVFAIFRSGNYYYGHQHYDQNSFMIFKDYPLAVDNGIYNVGPPTYKKATRFHNTILVGDPGVDTSNDDDLSGQSGASPVSYLAYPESSSSDKGDIVFFESGADYAYAAGDAGKAYNPGRLTAFVRKFLFLKPDFFVVLDRVVLPTARYPVRWMLQSETEPYLSANQVVLTNGTGRLFCRTLLPSNVNYSVKTLFPGMPEYGGGNYRVDEIPSTAGSEEYFLHVMWATGSGTATMPAVRMLDTSSGNMIGAEFSGHVVLLSRNGTVAAKETYSVSASSKIAHLVVDLKPARVYRIFQNGRLLATVTATRAGVVEFTSVGGGAFEIE